MGRDGHPNEHNGGTQRDTDALSPSCRGPAVSGSLRGRVQMIEDSSV